MSKHIYVVFVHGPFYREPTIFGAYLSKESAEKACKEARDLNRKYIDGYDDNLYGYDIVPIPLYEEEL